MMTAAIALLVHLSCHCPWVEVVDCREAGACPGSAADRTLSKPKADRPPIDAVILSYVRSLVEGRSLDAIGERRGAPLHVLSSVPLGSTFHGSVVAIKNVSEAILYAQKRGREVYVVRAIASPPPKGWEVAGGTWLLVETGTVQKTTATPEGSIEWRFVSDGNSEYRVVSGADGALTFELRSVLAL